MIFKPYSKEELGNSKFYQPLFKEWLEVKNYDLGDFSGDKPAKYLTLLRRLELSLKDISLDLEPKLKEKYQNSLLELKFFLLNDLSEEEIVDLFKKYFVAGIKTEIDIKKRLHIFVQGISRLGHRDPFLAKLSQALKENKELIGDFDILLKKEGKRVRPYLSNWLLDFENFLGIGKHSTLEVTNYFFKNSNVKSLTIEERSLLRKIIDFYELLKLTVTDPDSLSSYPLYVYGFKKVGEGLGARYVPNTPEAAAYLQEEEKRERAVRRQEKGFKSEKFKKEAIRFRPLTKEKKEEPEEIKAEKFKKELSGKAIPQNAILKLNSQEGLAQLTLEDFRFYSPGNPREAARFLFNKIKKLILGKPAERLQISKAFKNSALYKLYLSQGKEAIDSTATIGEVAKLRAEEHRPYLSEEECKAIGAIGKAT